MPRVETRIGMNASAQCAGKGHPLPSAATQQTPTWSHPEGRLPAGALRCCGWFMENDTISPPRLALHPAGNRRGT